MLFIWLSCSRLGMRVGMIGSEIPPPFSGEVILATKKTPTLRTSFVLG